MRETPNDPVALTRLAELQMREGSLDQATKTYEKVTADNPSFAPPCANLHCFTVSVQPIALGRLRLSHEGRQAYPDDPDIAKAAGVLSYRRGFYPQSLELLKAASAKRKDDGDLFYFLGELQRQLAQWDECKQSLERALASNLRRNLSTTQSAD